MQTLTTTAAVAPGHVEAFRSTGTSPGRSGSTVVTIPRHEAPLHVRVTFEVHGPERAHPVVVLGGISAGRHLAPTKLDPTPGWWPGVVGANGALDPDHRTLIGIDYIGTGPCGAVSTEDQAHALAGVLDHLGVPTVTLVGASYGGMVALAFASLFPHRVTKVVALCAAHRPHPMATALRSVQRRIVRLGRESGAEARGVALARSLAMTTYRTAEEFEARFDSRAHDPTRSRFPVESYLEARGDAFAARVDASTYLTLSASVDTHHVDPDTIVSDTTVISFATDTLVPPWLVAELAVAAPGVSEHIDLPSCFGHDAFLKEVDAVGDVLASALQDPGAGR